MNGSLITTGFMAWSAAALLTANAAVHGRRGKTYGALWFLGGLLIGAGSITAIAP